MNRPTIFIKSVDGHSFSVDINFLTRCPNPHLESTYTLINDFQLVRFLHNLSGPAVLPGCGYFLLGEGLPKDKFEEKSKNFRFSNKLNEILDE